MVDQGGRTQIVQMRPGWGNGGSTHLDAVAIRAGILMAGATLSRDAVYFRPENQRTPWYAYLYPIIDDGSGNPAEPGPCVALSRVQ